MIMHFQIHTLDLIRVENSNHVFYDSILLFNRRISDDVIVYILPH